MNMGRSPKKAPDKKNGRGVELSKIEVIDKISVHLKRGLTILKACNAYNVDTEWKDYISPLTVTEWYTNIPSVSEIIDALRQHGEVESHKTWMDNIKSGNYQAAREWLKVKDKENYGDAIETGPKMIIEFGMTPSQFITKAEVVQVNIPPDLPQSKQMRVSQIKKKPTRKPGKKESGEKPSISKKPEKKTGSSTKDATMPKKESAKQ